MSPLEEDLGSLEKVKHILADRRAALLEVPIKGIASGNAGIFDALN